MRTWIVIIIGLICYLPGQANGPVQSNFFKGSVEEARSKASQEGKLFLLDFYADWCTPCNWMKETTYTDVDVLEILDKDYVAIKINIDDLEGYDLKERYQVKYLPTILIFNSQSQLLLRIEETLSPSQMTQALTKYNVQEHKIAIRHDVNISPQDQSVSLKDQLISAADTANIIEAKEDIVPEKNTEENLVSLNVDSMSANEAIEEKIRETGQTSIDDESPKEILKKDIDVPSNESNELNKEIKNKVDGDSLERSDPKVVEANNDEEQTQITIKDNPSNESAETISESLPQEKISMRIEQDPDLENELGNFKYTKKVTQKYRLQVGVYSKFTNTYEIVNDLKSKFAEPVIVLNDSIDGKVMYRIFLGEFYEISEAESFQKMIQRKHNLQSVIK